MSENISENMAENISENESEIMSENPSEIMPENMSEIVPENPQIVRDNAEILMDSRHVLLEADLLKAAGYVLQQNGAKLLRSVTIGNLSDRDWEDLELSISSRPPLTKPLSRHIDHLPAGSRLHIRDLNPSIDLEYLATLTEKTGCILRVTMKKEDNLLKSLECPFSILAYDQWTGSGLRPELLCSFIMPNHPEIIRLSQRASEILGQWTGDPSLDAYQSMDQNRVLRQAAAVYSALLEENISYSVPPASFEAAGQRVRLPGSIMEQKLGTCLDLSLLYASVLESIGLRPLIIMTKNHAFAGFWLEELTFPEPVQDDPSLLAKRLADGINEIVVVECTAFVAGKSLSFDNARQLAEGRIMKPDDIEYFIDVRRARLSGIRPMPALVRTSTGFHAITTSDTPSAATQAPREIPGTRADDVPAPEDANSRLQRWERKLLDIGLRNSLINMRLSRSTVPILAGAVDELEDALANGTEFSVLPRPVEWDEADRIAAEGGSITYDNTDAGSISYSDIENNDIGNGNIRNGSIGNGGVVHDMEDLRVPEKYLPLIHSEFKSGRLRSNRTEAELGNALKELYRSAKTSLEENGANTLYLALGFLRWYENPRSRKARYAPLVLLPMEMLKRPIAKGGYGLRLREEEAQMNITILEKLKQDFGINVQGLDPLPEDEHGIDTRLVFSIIRKAVMGQKNWDVLETACLGIFSFSQFVMWNDLRNRTEDLEKNKIVRSLMDGKLQWAAEDMVIGDRVSEDGVFLPLPADASQLYAIEAAGKGESFVLHGPPGTGKSQTITTMIANCLANGKTVLFVAEKMAALEVVEKRLRAIGIGAFCLELHSNKSKKRDVLEKLRMAIDAARSLPPEEFEAMARKARSLREELDQYAHELHKTQPCGLSLFSLINMYEKRADAPSLPSLSPSMVQGLTKEQMSEQDSLLHALEMAGRTVGHPSGHPLSPVGRRDYSQHIRMELPEKISAYRTALAGLEKAAAAFQACFDMPLQSYGNLETAFSLSGELQAFCGLPKSFSHVEDLPGFLQLLREAARHYLAVQRLHAALSEEWLPSFLALNGASLLAEYRSHAAKWLIPKALGMRSLKKRLLPSSRNGRIHDEKLQKHLEDLTHYQYELSQGEDLAQKLEQSAGTKLWNELLAAGGNGQNGQAMMNGLNENNVQPGLSGMNGLLQKNWQYILQMADMAEKGASSLKALTGSDEFRRKYCGRQDVGPLSLSFLKAWNELVPIKTDLYRFLELSMDEVPNKADNAMDAMGSEAAVRTGNDVRAGDAVGYIGAGKAGTTRDARQSEGAGNAFHKAENTAFSKEAAQAGANSADGAGAAQAGANSADDAEAAQAAGNAAGSAGAAQAAGNWISKELALCGVLLERKAELREWIAWNNAAEKAEQAGMEAIVKAYRDGLPHCDVRKAWEKAIARDLCIYSIDASPALSSFSGILFDEKIERFRRLDQDLLKLSRQEIYCRLASKIPNFAREAAQSSELGILQRAIRSGGRGTSLRKLFSQIPGLLSRLCPCMLMSPISAAQYLDPKREPFDLIVFDEASQLPTCKAVGALARGRNAVIVGDPKQMPPTSFFVSSRTDEDELETEDLESILDDCLALNMPATHLLWHYRSRHESLISFSNQRFYENRLFTFPSVNDREKKVRFIQIDGVFERGRNRQNRAEAEAIVQELSARCHDPERAKFSVGVITFNINQQNLIDDLLAEACAADPQLEAWAYGGEEPLFIKNLENVQGDERDVILFSIGYGPDPNGRVSMNFGPLNREGGWRRLNVAVSRARCEMTVFSTLLPEQIDLQRSSSEGVASLKAFLEYARKQYADDAPEDIWESSPVETVSNSGLARDTVTPGHGEAASIKTSAQAEDAAAAWHGVTAALNNSGTAGFSDAWQHEGGSFQSRNERMGGIRGLENGISESIRKALSDAGYRTDRNVGKSEYRIDIGVIDPAESSRYILGILLDGASYAAAKSTRDREIAQINILRGLGWNLLRVWSMDWWDNRQKELDKILTELKHLEENNSHKMAGSPSNDNPPDSTDRTEGTGSIPGESISLPDSTDKAEETPSAAARTNADFSKTTAEGPVKTEKPEAGKTPETPGFPASEWNLRKPEAFPIETTTTTATASPIGESPFGIYKEAVLKQYSMSTAVFTGSGNLSLLKESINEVLLAEAPISEGLLFKRICRSFGIQRITGKIQEYLSSLIRSMNIPSTEQAFGRFLWKAGQDPFTYRGFRSGGENGTRRDIREIPIQEAGNAILFSLMEQGAMSREDLLREAAKLMGFTRTGGNVSKLFEEALQYCLRQAYIAENNAGNIALTDSGQHGQLMDSRRE